MIKLSIITVVYNAAIDLKTTIDSVRNAKSASIEYIVIDGGSNDNTLDVADDNRDIVDYFISERDNGIFDAMNKGIRAAKGQWLIFINAGDTILFESKGLFKILNASQSTYILCGNTRYKDGISLKPYPLKMIQFGSLPVCHQSMLYNKSLLGQELYYSNKFSLFGENEGLMRFYKSKYKIEYVDMDISFFKGGGISDAVHTEGRKAKYYYLWKHFGLKGILRGIQYKLKLKEFERIKKDSDFN